MAAFTTIALGVAAAASAGQAVAGAARASKAKKALENFQRQELKNVTGGMRVSTLGAELQTQEAQRRFATGVEALRSGGVRGLVGGLGIMEQQQQQMQQQISADLDQQQQAIEQARVQDEANIRSMTEQRESSQIAGLGAEIASGRQQLNAGLTNIAQVGLAAASLSEGGSLGGGGGESSASGGFIASPDFNKIQGGIDSLSSFSSIPKQLPANYSGILLPQASSFIGRSSTYKSKI